MVAHAPNGEIATDARAAIVTGAHGCLVAGTRLKASNLELSAEKPEWSGRITSVGSERGDSWFVLDGTPIPRDVLAGSVLFVAGDDGMERPYPIRQVELHDNGTRAFTKVGHVGFEARPAKTWRVLSTVAHE